MIVSNSPIGEAEVADHYDRLNHFYCDVWGLHRHHGFWETGQESPEDAIALMAGKISAAAKIDRGGRVVDVGCGTGGIAWLMARESDAEVMGYTVSEKEKETAEKFDDSSDEKVKTLPRFICSDWLENDLPDNWADAVVLIESLSHMENRMRVLVEATRVLKPGGRLLIADWLASAKPKGWQVKWLLKPICQGGKLTGLSSIEEGQNLLNELSLQVTEASDLTTSVSKTWHHITAKLMRKLASDAAYRKFMWQSLFRDRTLFFSIPRVIIAYATGCLKYGWLVAEKGSCEEA